MGRSCFFFQAEDGIRDLVRSRGLGDVYKRQAIDFSKLDINGNLQALSSLKGEYILLDFWGTWCSCLLYTSDAADERSSVDLGGRRIIKKKNHDTEVY